MKNLPSAHILVIVLLSLIAVWLPQGGRVACAGEPIDTAAEVSPDSGIVFVIAGGLKQTAITFQSRAPLEDFTGKAGVVEGYLAFDPAAPDRGGRGLVRVPVSSLNTGIPLRDEHLRDADWLDVEQFPDIEFRIDSLEKITIVDSAAGAQTYEATVHGVLALHGQRQPMTISGRFTYLEESDKTRKIAPGDWLAIRTRFQVALADFGITGPARTGIVGSRVGDSVTVDVNLVGISR